MSEPEIYYDEEDGPPKYKISCKADLHISDGFLSDVETALANRDMGTVLSAIDDLKGLFCSEISNLKELINRQNREITRIRTENASLIRRLVTDKKDIYVSPRPGNDNFSRFPVYSKEELERLNIDIEGREEEFVNTVEALIYPGGLKKNLHKLLAEPIIMNFNYDGIKNKQSLKEHKRFVNILFRAAQKETGVREDEFLQLIKASFRLHKNRYFKNECLKRKSSNQPKDEFDFVNIADFKRT